MYSFLRNKHIEETHVPVHGTTTIWLPLRLSSDVCLLFLFGEDVGGFRVKTSLFCAEGITEETEGKDVGHTLYRAEGSKEFCVLQFVEHLALVLV
jgi:hypothetical protein